MSFYSVWRRWYNVCSGRWNCHSRCWQWFFCVVNITLNDQKNYIRTAEKSILHLGYIMSSRVIQTCHWRLSKLSCSLHCWDISMWLASLTVGNVTNKFLVKLFFCLFFYVLPLSAVNWFFIHGCLCLNSSSCDVIVVGGPGVFWFKCNVRSSMVLVWLLSGECKINGEYWKEVSSGLFSDPWRQSPRFWNPDKKLTHDGPWVL